MKGTRLGGPPEGTAKEPSGTASKEVAAHDKFVEPTGHSMTDGRETR